MRDRSHSHTKTAGHLTETDERQCQEGDKVQEPLTIIVSTVPHCMGLKCQCFNKGLYFLNSVCSESVSLPRSNAASRLSAI